MKKTYELIFENNKGFSHIEYDNINSSVNYWSKYAKQQEKEDCFVIMDFDYYTDIGEICMVKYYSVNKKTGRKETVRLIRNKEKLQRLNKK